MRKLYEIADDYRRVLDGLDDAVNEDTGELAPDAAAALDALEGEFTAKIEGVARYVREMDAEAVTFQAEARLLAAKAHARANKAKWLKDYIQAQMEAAGRAKVQGELLTIAVQKSPPSLGVLDEKSIPAQFWAPQPPKLDSRGVLDLLKAGGEVPGAEMRQGQHIRIR